jgi:hypothetical protein
MARRTTDVPAELLIPVATIAIRTRMLDEVIWRAVEQRGWKAQQDWDDSWVVPRSQARQIYQEITGAVAAADVANRKAMDEQMDREHQGRMWPSKAFELAEKQAARKVRGVQTFGPDDPTPSWGEGATTNEGLRGTRRRSPQAGRRRVARPSHRR